MKFKFDIEICGMFQNTMQQDNELRLEKAAGVQCVSLTIQLCSISGQLTPLVRSCYIAACEVVACSADLSSLYACNPTVSLAQ